MSMKALIAGILVASLLFVGACERAPGDGGATNATTPTAAKPDAPGRCPHDIKQEKCPFCNPTLVESEGFCAEHGVPEALCAPCRPYLKAAFRAKGDWCKEHGTPESQCVACHPELKEKMKSGAGHGAAAPPAADGAKPVAADA